MIDTSSDSTAIEALWDYNDPAASEARFQAALGNASGDTRLELLSQIARTYSLRRRFADAHALLDDVEAQLAGSGPRPRIRSMLERGRSFNSAGETAPARAIFVAAWEQAQAAGEAGLAVDAAHMVAITYSGMPEAIEWNQRALALARTSHDAKAQALIPALLNNTGWDLHDMGRYAEALALFEAAQAEHSTRGNQAAIQIARWSVARCLRSLGRYPEALAIQQALAAEHQAAGTEDGYVFQELAENLVALGRDAEAKPYFEKAIALVN